MTRAKYQIDDLVVNRFPLVYEGRGGERITIAPGSILRVACDWRDQKNPEVVLYDLTVGATEWDGGGIKIESVLESCLDEATEGSRAKALLHNG